MNAHAQRKIERHRPIFDEQIVIALPPIDDRHAAAGGGQKGRTTACDNRPRNRIIRPSDGCEPHLVARTELAHLPEVVACNHEGADKAAEARAIGPEDDRHVASEVEGAARIGRVVQIRRMQPSLAAIGPRPAGRRADQAHTRAGAVEVNFIGRGEQVRYIGVLEEIGRTVRTVENAKRPIVGQFGWRPGRSMGRLRLAHMERIPRLQHAGRVTAEGAEREGRLGAENRRFGKAATHGQVGPLPRPRDGADGKHVARCDLEGGTVRRRVRVEHHVHRRPRQRHRGRGMEAQRRPGNGQLQRRGLRRVADEAIGVPERARVHRATRRHANCPQADAARQFLQAGLRACAQHLDAARRILEGL